MKRQSENAATIARWLERHPRIAHVNYPGLRGLGAAETQFNNSGRGGMLSFDIRDAGRDEVFAFLKAIRLVQSAITLGDVYTLALYPAMSSHRALTPEQRAAAGIGEGLVRLSVGIEDVDDLIGDLDRALCSIPK
jgi:cystathionine gamma-synthase/methionine-gamma-lyase